MERRTTLFLKLAIFLIGMIVFVLCIFWLPWVANDTTERFSEYAYLKLPVLIGLYVTVVPFTIALYQAFKLLNYMDNNQVFTGMSVKLLKDIKYCAITISFLYVIGSIFLIINDALHPGIAIIGITIIFTSVVIAVFSSLLQRLLLKALHIKVENELTV